MDVPQALQRAIADRYQIERQLGAGGMATVYLARDLRHNRSVAVKVLRPELGAAVGSERFLREVETTAQFAHPHILPLLDSGAATGTLFYVMPYVEGESLRERLRRERQLPLDDALQVTREVADALWYAHSHGVIHRDIKPENILLEAGHAVVADFGIARAVSVAGGTRLTDSGLAVGTPAYMSPEQAAGDSELDGRSDVYSLGCVLYEMLSGETPYWGPTPQAILAKKLSEPLPRISVVRAAVTPGVEAVVNRALARNPVDRFQTAAELAEALQHGEPMGAPFDAGVLSRRRRMMPVTIAVAVLAVAVAALMLAPRGMPEFTLGRSELLSEESGLAIQPAISPDGKLVAYSAGNSAKMRIYIRPIGGGRTIPLSDDSSSVETQARWSPDGSSLLFLTHGGVSIAPALGGASRAVVPPSPTSDVTTAAWSPSGLEIAFARGDSLFVTSISGGGTRLVWGANWALHSCAWSPRGKWIACILGNSAGVVPGRNFGNTEPSTLALFPAAGGAPMRLVEQRSFNQGPVWSPDAKRLYFVSNRDGPRDIYAMTLSSSGRPRGEPARLTAGLGALSISFSADGRRLAYAAYAARSNIWSMPVLTGGVAAATRSSATQLTSGHQVIESVRVSRDGRWLLYDSDLRGNSDIYRIPVGGGQAEQLTRDPADEFGPDLSPDGRSVAYHSFRLGTRNIEVAPLNGGPIERVTTYSWQASFPIWLPDGRAITFLDQAPCCTTYIVRRGPSGQWLAPERLASLAGPSDVSPDGQELALIGARSQEGPALSVLPVSGGRARFVIQGDAGSLKIEQALWSPDGKRLYFKAHDPQWRASFWVVPDEGGRPRLLVRFDDPNFQSYRQFFATDGKRFYFPVEERQSDIYVAELVAK